MHGTEILQVSFSVDRRTAHRNECLKMCVFVLSKRMRRASFVLNRNSQRGRVLGLPNKSFSDFPSARVLCVTLCRRAVLCFHSSTVHTHGVVCQVKYSLHLVGRRFRQVADLDEIFICAHLDTTARFCKTERSSILDPCKVRLILDRCDPYEIH